MNTDLLNYPLGVTVVLKKTARVHGTITREGDGLVPLSPWSWTSLPLLTVGASKMMANYLNECKMSGENSSWRMR
jgi:hypothetical protein